MNEKAPATGDRRRALLGVGVLLLGAAAVLIWWQGRPETASVLFRSAILLAAVWLAYPSLRSTRWGVLLAVAGGAALILTRWRAVAAVILGLLVLVSIWGRIRRKIAPPE